MSPDQTNGPGAVVAARGPDTGGCTPMTTSSYGATSRRPVFSCNRRVAGLYERTLARGATVYEVKARLGGKVRRHRLDATTKTDALAELRALQVDYSRGEEHRSGAGLTVSSSSWPRRRYSARTVDKYRQRVSQHIVPAFGHREVTS